MRFVPKMGGSNAWPDGLDRTLLKRMKLPIATILAVGFGSLTLMSVAVVLYTGIYGAGRNTLSLLADKATLVQESLETRIRQQFEPAELQAAYILDLFEDRTLDPADMVQINDTLRGALAATPQVTGIGFIRDDYQAVRISRAEGPLQERTETIPPGTPIHAAMQAMVQTDEPFWAEPAWSGDVEGTILTYRSPVNLDGVYRGSIVIAISLADLSQFLEELAEGEDIEAAVLLGRDYVVAHRNLTRLTFDFSDGSRLPPLPRIDEVDDPVIAQMWEGGLLLEALEEERVWGDLDLYSEVVRIGNHGQYFQIREILGYGPALWMTVIHFPAREVGEEFLRLILTSVFGIVVLVGSVIAAFWIGRRMARRIGQVAKAADALSRLDFHDVPKIEDSRIRELSMVAGAFDRMVSGLTWFEAYVPKSLVAKLMRSSEGQYLASDEREVTILFTDIRDFSGLSERMAAEDVAALLNNHFDRMTRAIESEGGTVDKFMGDGIMAFWGAPEDQPDHAARAVRAVKAMVQALDRANLERIELGIQPIAIRIGLHTGTVVVGNIGAESRINYTIIGDSVNTAARLQELGRDFLKPDENWIVLASDATIAAAGEAGFVDLGPKPLRGLSETIGVYRLTDPAT